MTRKLPPGWVSRPGTFDTDIATSVILENEYRLPRRFEPDDLILDIGGHIGSFAYAVLDRGAGEVHSFEVDPDNAAILRQNLQRFGSRACVHQIAVYGTDAPPRLYFQRSNAPANTGGGGLTGDATGSVREVEVVTFDHMIDEVSRRGERRVRLLKLDCEGSEWSILSTSQRLDLIDEVCGEYHLAPEGKHPERSVEALHQMLEPEGFHMTVIRSPAHPLLGLFFATRRPAAERSLWSLLRRWVLRRAG
jgi:FkbM family methyltransferase